MSCSARLPVYTLLIAAFVPELRLLGGWLSLQGLVMLGLYLVGVLTAVAVAWILNRTILRSQTPAFVMELPNYRIPSLYNIFFRVLDGAWAFVRQAGTLIFAVAVLVWAAAYFPHSAEIEREIRGQYRRQIGELRGAIDQLNGPVASDGGGGADRQRLADPRRQLAALEREIANRVAGAYMAQSVLGRLGRLIEPAVKPLGWDWRIGCAVIASLPAREAVIGTLGVIYDLGEQQDGQSKRLRVRLQSATWPGTDRAVFNIPVALSIMVFFALCAQCMATLVVIGQETSSWRWPLFTFAYMTTLAYLGALATYQVGIRMIS
jgi:ferrous iron transport protein B